VGRVPTELGCVDPGCVVAPGGVVVVPGCDCVVEVPVCGPIPGLGVTVPVLCAVAHGSSQIFTRVLTIATTLNSTYEPTPKALSPASTYHPLLVATYSIARNTLNSNNAAPRSRWKIIKPIAMPHMPTKGTR